MSKIERPTSSLSFCFLFCFIHHLFHLLFHLFLYFFFLYHYHHHHHVIFDSINCNPSSQKGNQEILKKIVQQMETIDSKKKREFLLICVDGTPLKFLYQLIESEREKFDHIILILGAGHEELNMLKTFNTAT